MAGLAGLGPCGVSPAAGANVRFAQNPATCDLMA